MMVGTRHRPQWHYLLIVLGLAAAVLAVYGQVWDFGFTSFDDDRFIGNAMVRQGLSLAGVKWALTTLVNGAWMPLTWLSHMLDTQLFGQWAGGHHLTNVLFHLANTLLLYVVLYRLTGALGRSALVAALFALHPLHVESVAWIAERRDVQSAFWSFLAMLAYVRWTGNGGGRWWGITAVCFIAALAAKPMAVTLPVVFLLLDVWPLDRAGSAEGILYPKGTPLSTPLRGIRFARAGKLLNSSLTSRGGRILANRLLEKIPFLAISLIVSVTTILAEDKQGAVGSLAVYPLFFRVKIALLAYCRYLGLTLWPSGLLPHYPYPDTISTLAVITAFLFLAMVTLWCLAGLRKRPYLAVGWFWYLITMLPVIGLIQQGSDFSLADRYTYFPLIGIFIILVWGGAEIGHRFRLNTTILWGGSLVLCVILAAVSYRQAGFWRDTPTLFSHALELDPANRVALSQLGVYYRERGQLADAAPYLEKAAKLYPKDFDARANLGQEYDYQGRFQAALVELDAAHQIIPGRADVVVSMGIIRARQGDLAGAERDLAKALQLDPTYLDAKYNLGMVHLQQGRLGLAEQELAGLTRTQPGFAEAYNGLGLVLLARGRKNEAVAAFREAIRLNSALQDARDNLRDALSNGSRAGQLP